MNKNIIEIENKFEIVLPNLYKFFLENIIKEEEVYEINNSGIYLYGASVVLERNETYQIQDFEPSFLMIGQDGDLGYFINIKSENESIYNADLGALGSIEMTKITENITKLLEIK
ncbi:SMI1/KNR4 family protein [Flavobacterium branchiophilum]|uniref:Knr4/Smi1-like domain-containing protein n=1 Tax=Flavobacterium branchiophilum (strain FL-15) TaxID=1034807 RepID=G2Z5N5_FLABF|nr:SMI1/KNR4 family protein [Flavobacterium branchiophilum]CCB70833.1 Hypothetical protein FBFL15_2863 [Flavobacterium branchiophilum FL-15]